MEFDIPLLLLFLHCSTYCTLEAGTVYAIMPAHGYLRLVQAGCAPHSQPVLLLPHRRPARLATAHPVLLTPAANLAASLKLRPHVPFRRLRDAPPPTGPVDTRPALAATAAHAVPALGTGNSQKYLGSRSLEMLWVFPKLCPPQAARRPLVSPGRAGNPVIARARVSLPLATHSPTDSREQTAGSGAMTCTGAKQRQCCWPGSRRWTAAQSYSAAWKHSRWFDSERPEARRPTFCPAAARALVNNAQAFHPPPVRGAQDGGAFGAANPVASRDYSSTD